MSTVDLNDLDVFARVVAEGSFSGAARGLALPTSTVSRRIARLEKACGLTLLHRTTRRVALTEAGRVFHDRTVGLRSQVDAALREASRVQESPSGILRVTMPPDYHGVLWPLMSDFLVDYPEVDLPIRETLEAVDLLKDGIDVALRGGAPPDSTEFTAQVLFTSRILLAASPVYLAQHGTPERVEDLANHMGLGMDGWAPNAIRRLDGDRGYVHVSLRNRLRVNAMATAQRAAVDGLGIAPLLALTCQEELACGALVEVLRGALPPEATMWLVSPRARVKSAAAGAFVGSVMAAARRLHPEQR